MIHGIFTADQYERITKQKVKYGPLIATRLLVSKVTIALGIIQWEN